MNAMMSLKNDTKPLVGKTNILLKSPARKITPSKIKTKIEPNIFESPSLRIDDKTKERLWDKSYAVTIRYKKRVFHAKFSNLCDAQKYKKDFNKLIKTNPSVADVISAGHKSYNSVNDMSPYPDINKILTDFQKFSEKEYPNRNDKFLDDRERKILIEKLEKDKSKYKELMHYQMSLINKASNFDNKEFTKCSFDIEELSRKIGEKKILLEKFSQNEDLSIEKKAVTNLIQMANNYLSKFN